jgi:hypothetical protein
LISSSSTEPESLLPTELGKEKALALDPSFLVDYADHRNLPDYVVRVDCFARRSECRREREEAYWHKKACDLHQEQSSIVEEDRVERRRIEGMDEELNDLLGS